MGLNITTVEFISAFPSTSGVEFSHAVLDLAPAMTKDLSDDESKLFLQQVVDEVEKFALLWVLVMAAKDTFLKDSARMFGFGLAKTFPSTARRPVLPPPKQPRPDPATAAHAYHAHVPQAAALTPLMEQELILKRKWILRLENIARSAGAAAKFNDADPDDVLLPEERDLSLIHI